MLRSALVLIATCAAFSQAQQIDLFSCRTLPNLMTNFEINQFQGEWYQQAGTFDLFKLGTSCIRSNVSAVDNTTVLFHMSGEGWFNIPYEDYIGTAVEGNSNTGQYRVARSLLGIDVSFPLYILATDYTTYALLWSCSGFGINFEFAWIWTRQRIPDPTLKIVQNAKAQALRFNINSNWFLKTEQVDCKTYG